MLLFFCLIFILALYQCKPIIGKGFYADYVSIDQTRSINGICIMLILLSHTFAKVSVQGALDTAYEPIRIFLGQFVVVPFLFYSGYGIMESVSGKESYIKTFPKKRFLKLAVQFAIITVIYILMHLLIGNKYSVEHILLSFTGIRSIGNGGWYMLSTFVFYIAIILSFNLFQHQKIFAVLGVTFCLICLMVVEMILNFPSYYYSTTIFFAVGMFYSLLKKPFDNFVMKNNIIWGITLLVGIAGFALLKTMVNRFVLLYPVWCSFGMLMILCITMKVRIKNCALIWLGQTVFFNFTLQGIPQIIFSQYLSNNFVIYILVLVTSLVLTYLADSLFKKSEMLFSDRK